MAFSYTCCTDLNDSLKSVPYSSCRFCVQEVYQTGRSRCSLYTWCTTIDHSSKFTRPWRTICRERNFRTIAVRICTAPQSRTPYSCNRSEYASCTKLGGPVAPCTPGVRPLDHSSMFNRSWRTICSERHFRTPTVRICTALRSRTPYSCIRLCVHKLYQTGRSRCSLYTRCTTIRPLKYVHYAVANNLQSTAFMYTRCTYLYGCLQ